MHRKKEKNKQIDIAELKNSLDFIERMVSDIIAEKGDSITTDILVTYECILNEINYCRKKMEGYEYE